MLPTTIQGVLDRLDQIIQDNQRKQSPLAYFAILYRTVTANVLTKIENGDFENGTRMERLDVVFANRYIDAYDQYHSNSSLTESWKIAFDATSQTDLLILQHLLLGMNAHIDLDLGIAAATIAPDNQIHDLKNDFNQINAILFSMVEMIQERVSKVSPLLGVLDRFGGADDERLAKFGLSKTRDHAWRLACMLAPLPQNAWPPVINTADKATTLLSKLIRQPKTRVTRGLVRLVREFESTDVLKNMDALAVS